MPDDHGGVAQLAREWEQRTANRAVFINGDHAPSKEAETWVRDPVSAMVAAMADAGIEVPCGPVVRSHNQVSVELDGQTFLARDLDEDPDHGGLSLERILARFASIAAKRGAAQRWHYWYTGDPVGTAWFLAPPELLTSTGVDIRDLDPYGGQWFEAIPDDR